MWKSNILSRLRGLWFYILTYFYLKRKQAIEYFLLILLFFGCSFLSSFVKFEVRPFFSFFPLDFSLLCVEWTELMWLRMWACVYVCEAVYAVHVCAYVYIFINYFHFSNNIIKSVLGATSYNTTFSF